MSGIGKEGIIAVFMPLFVVTVIDVFLFSLFLSWYLAIGFWDLVVAYLWFLLIMIAVGISGFLTLRYGIVSAGGDGPVKKRRYNGGAGVRTGRKTDGESNGVIPKIGYSIVGAFMYAVFISFYFGIDLMSVFQGFLWWTLIVISVIMLMIVVIFIIGFIVGRRIIIGRRGK